MRQDCLVVLGMSLRYGGLTYVVISLPVALARTDYDHPSAATLSASSQIALPIRLYRIGPVAKIAILVVDVLDIALPIPGPPRLDHLAVRSCLTDMTRVLAGSAVGIRDRYIGLTQRFCEGCILFRPRYSVVGGRRRRWSARGVE